MGQNDGQHAPSLHDSLLESFESPSEYVVRVYILKVGGLAQRSNGKPPDAYVRVRLGQETYDTKKEFKSAATHADIYRVFEFQSATLPGDSTLEVAVLDANLLGFDDVVGHTELDLEDRVFSTMWNTHHYHKPPIEKRYLQTNGSTMHQGWITMFVERKPFQPLNNTPAHSL